MKAVDAAAIHDHGISLEMMMENAGRAVSAALLRTAQDLEGLRVLVAAGPGNNGGGGLASVRHLLAAGSHVEVVLSRPLVQLLGLPRTYAEVARNLGVTFWRVDGRKREKAIADSDWVVDALLGYNQKGPLRTPVDEVAEAVGLHGARVLALDLPTGMDPDSGRLATQAVWATQTVTLGLPKAGLAAKGARKVTGPVWVASLGLPDVVYASAGLEGPFPRFEPDGLTPWP